MKVKLAILFLFVLCASCSQVTMKNVYKQKQIAGFPNQPNFVVYNFELNTVKNLVLKGMELVSENETISIDEYSFIDVMSQTGQKVTQPNHKLEAGTYQITFRIDATSAFMNNEKLFVLYGDEIDPKRISKRVEVRLKPVVNR